MDIILSFAKPIIKTFIAPYKTLLLSLLAFIVLFPLFLTVIRVISPVAKSPPPAAITPAEEITGVPTSSVNAQQRPFHVISTYPINGQTGFSTQETTISFTTDTPIISPTSFSLEFSPSLPYSYTLKTSFPATTVSILILGGLNKNTLYRVSIFDTQHVLVYSWTFTTSLLPVSVSPDQTQDQQQTFNAEYPLFNYVPYSNNDFSIDYSGPKTLEVKIKNSDTEMVKQEVISWIKSHGVDPDSQIINYTNAF